MTKDINLLIKEIKRDFFVYRNGIVAAALKKIYDTNILIYGLNVPQFIELAKKYPKDLELGNCLWQDKVCRESRLFS